MELHEIIRQHRLDNGLTQEQLAEQLFMSRQSISRWETGRVLPPLNVLYDLAKFYNLSLDEFLGGKKIMKKTKFNIFSFLGSLVFNFLLLSTVGIFTLSMWLSACIIVLAFCFSPVLLFVVNITGKQAFSWEQTLYAILLFVVGILLIKPMIFVSKFLYRIVVKYFRYNMSNIYYEIEE